MSESEERIIAYIVDKGKVKPLVLNEEHEVVVEETVVDEGY